jgi:hypothetical protein
MGISIEYKGRVRIQIIPKHFLTYVNNVHNKELNGKCCLLRFDAM